MLKTLTTQEWMRLGWGWQGEKELGGRKGQISRYTGDPPLVASDFPKLLNKMLQVLQMECLSLPYLPYLYVEALTSHQTGIEVFGDEAFGRWLGHKAGALKYLDCLFLRKDARELGLSLQRTHWGKAIWEHSMKAAPHKPGKKAVPIISTLPESWSWDFWGSRTVRK